MKKKVQIISTNDWAPWGGSEALWGATAWSLHQRQWTVGIEVLWYGHLLAGSANSSLAEGTRSPRVTVSDKEAQHP